METNTAIFGIKCLDVQIKDDWNIVKSDWKTLGTKKQFNLIAFGGFVAIVTTFLILGVI